MERPYAKKKFPSCLAPVEKRGSPLQGESLWQQKNVTFWPRHEELNGGVGEERTNATQLLMSELGGVNTLDKVRDILFGGQAREFERHFSRMEDRLLLMLIRFS